MKREQAIALAEKTADAYSFNAYANWTAVAAMLLRRGYSMDQAEDILRSKITRWAGDESEARYGRYTSADIARYLGRNEQAIAWMLEWNDRGIV